jgi:spore coat polysaccharide biosynthesis protein SpsF
MLARVVERVRKATLLDTVVVAVPVGEEEELLAATGDGVQVHVGPEFDVLARYYQVAKALGLDTIVRVTADCPLIDPGVIDGVVRLYQSGDYDYTANNLERSFPHGLDCECFPFAALELANLEASNPWEREHVTEYIRRHSHAYRLGNLLAPQDLSRHRWTVDYPEDLALIRAIYSAFPLRQHITTADAIWLMDRRPELWKINEAPRLREKFA